MQFNPNPHAISSDYNIRVHEALVALRNLIFKRPMVGERKFDLDKLLVVCSSVYLNEDKDSLVRLFTRCGHFFGSSTYSSIHHCEI